MHVYSANAYFALRRKQEIQSNHLGILCGLRMDVIPREMIDG